MLNIPSANSLSKLPLTRRGIESLFKHPSTEFELFLHTHTKGHGKYINERSKTINENLLRLRQEKGLIQHLYRSGSTYAQVDEQHFIKRHQVVKRKETFIVFGQKELIIIRMLKYSN